MRGAGGSDVSRREGAVRRQWLGLVALMVLLAVGAVRYGCAPVVRTGADCPSPDGSIIATAFLEMGGGAAGWTVGGVSLRAAGDPFATEPSPYSATRVAGACIRWTGSRQLVLGTSFGGSTLERRTSIEVGTEIIDVSYEPVVSNLGVPDSASCPGCLSIPNFPAR